MKTPFLTACLAFAVLAQTLSSPAASVPWRTDFESAKAEARKGGKIIVLNFTGSDWCGYCIKMKKEALDMKAFTDYAAKNAVLVEVDFPNRKKLPAALVKSNEALKKKFRVRGYPTFVVTDASGNEIGRQEGYLQGGPLAFVDKLERFKSQAKPTS